MVRSMKPPAAGKEKILSAAEQLFAAEGYHGASMRKITRNAGVELGLSTYHFRNKDDLYQQVLLRRAPEMAGALSAALDGLPVDARGSEGVAAILAAYVDAHLERLTCGDDGWRSYLQLAAETGLLLHRSELSGGAAQHYRPVLERFKIALMTAAGGGNEAEFDRRFHIFQCAVLSLIPEASEKRTGTEGRDPLAQSVVDIFTVAFVAAATSKR